MGCAASSATTAGSVPPEADSVSDSVSPKSDFAPPEFFDEYALGEKLGKGAFAQVRLAVQVNVASDKKYMAVKILDLRDKEEPDKTSNSLQKRASEEASIWASAMYHNNVVRLHRVFMDGAFCYYVMERCGSSLFAHMKNLPELNERTVGSILVQMLAGLSHVHSVRVVHRDVKPDNFLVGGRRGTVKLSDFGLSAVLPKHGKLEGSYGTAPFQCPEMLKRKGYNETADVWSMGVVAYCFLFGDFPYGSGVTSSKAMKQAIVEGIAPSFEPVAPCLGQVRSKKAVEFVQTLLERKPDQRLSAKGALKMPFMVAVAQNQHMNEVDLPSLRPLLYAAKRTGAFEVHNLMKETDIDPLLNEKHLMKHGYALPDLCLHAKDVLGKNCESRESGIWQPANGWKASESGTSFNSNVWGDTSSSATTVSGHASAQGTSPSGSFLPSPPRSDSGWSQLNSIPEA